MLDATLRHNRSALLRGIRHVSHSQQELDYATAAAGGTLPYRQILWR